MLSIQDQLSSAAHAAIRIQLAMQNAVSGKIMDSLQRMADLHLNLATAALGHANFAARQLMSAEDAPAFLSLAVAQIRPNATRSFDYGYYLATITADTQVDMVTAFGKTMTESNRELLVFAEEFSEALPNAIHSAAACLRSLNDSVARLYEELEELIRATMRSLNLSRESGPNRIAYAGNRTRRAAHR